MNYRNLRKVVWIQCYGGSQGRNTSHNPQTLPRIQNTSQNPKPHPRIQNRSQNPKHIPESGLWKVFLISGKCFGFWEVFLDSGKCFGFWEVFRNLGSALSLRTTVQCDYISENYLENSELNCCTVKRIWNPDFIFGYWSSCFCPMLNSGHFA